VQCAAEIGAASQPPIDAWDLLTGERTQPKIGDIDEGAFLLFAILIAEAGEAEIEGASLAVLQGQQRIIERANTVPSREICAGAERQEGEGR